MLSLLSKLMTMIKQRMSSSTQTGPDKLEPEPTGSLSRSEPATTPTNPPETLMSDLTDLFEGKFGNNPIEAVEAFTQKEWTNVVHLFNELPADIKPVADTLVTDAKTVLVDAAEWAGTAASAYVAAHGDALGSAVVGLLSGLLGGSSPTTIAAQDTISAATKLIQAYVTHEVMAFVAAQSPAPVAPQS